MTDIEKIVWGALGGLTIFVIGQLVAKFLIEPLHELRKAVGEVRFNLAFHAPTIHTPAGRSKEDSDKAREALMKSSCDLIADLHGIPMYDVTRLLAFRVLPCGKAIEGAAVQLRGLSTYVHQTGDKANSSLGVIEERVKYIEKVLGLKPLE
ncbi:MAG: hypothetical protein CV090_13275 [Nitrospira sp. WS238]|nr:hypothetical protein [Nitrospira sp. WS238]